VIDWARVRSTLERVGYQGVFMLEVTGDGDLAGHVARLASTHTAGPLAPARSRS
jgi:sugar phosphate isomerase/epimerase